ncbi:MAG TPA: diacylglycerol kinase family protein [Vineibacter sp.]|nr:diacylglycerol kinase family protein [Vineibacter sp.]
MRVSLIHNPAAGDDAFSREHLIWLLQEHGHDVVHEAAKNDDWSGFIEDPGDLVVVAGGDGTVGAVALKLIHRHVPIAILPTGTANNIARALRIGGGPAELIESWPRAQRRPMDVGVATGPWGKSWFIEGVGLGLFATAMAVLDERDGRTQSKPETRESKLERDVHTLKGLASEYPPLLLDGTIDGRRLSGKVLLVAAMNIASVGPNMDLAPNADPGDGQLDFALVREERRADFIDYVATRLHGGEATPPTDVHRGRSLRLAWSGYDAHIDDRAWRADNPMPEAHAAIEIDVAAQALEVLLPADTKTESR